MAAICPGGWVKKVMYPHWSPHSSHVRVRYGESYVSSNFRAVPNSHRISYREISWSLEGARLVSEFSKFCRRICNIVANPFFISLWILTGFLAALLLRHLTNFKVIWALWHLFLRVRVFIRFYVETSYLIQCRVTSHRGILRSNRICLIVLS